MKKIILVLIITFLFTAQKASACSLVSSAGLNFGTRSSAVTELQNCLIDAGFSIDGPATGYYGSFTLNAVKNFYKNILGMIWDGKSVGPKGLLSLKGQSVASGSGNTAYRLATDEADLKKYVNSNNTMVYAMGWGGAVPPMVASVSAESQSKASPSADGRVSQTNVQVAGIDEPDIIKTDGENLFMAKPSYWYWGGPMPLLRGDELAASSKLAIWPPFPQEKPKTQVIGITPVVDMALKSEAIEESGEMLYVENSKTLIVFTGMNVSGYDVSDSAHPKKSWTVKLENNTNIVTSRLKDGTVYIVTSTYLDSSRPCPVMPILQASDTQLTIPCNRILVPEKVTPVNQLYTVLKLDPKNGEVVASTSIAEDGYASTVSMFENNLYIATEFTGEYNRIYTDIYIASVKKYISAAALASVEKIKSYEISDNGKLNEIQQVVDRDLGRLSADEQMKTRNDIQNTINDGLTKRARELYRTKITQIPLNNLSNLKTTSVPGRLLNQFAMDEYNDALRIATTVGESWGGKSANDIYVLDMNLKETGKITDLGLTEKIYSVRFMGDVGYLVTFRQMDPFYVLDLKDKTKPTVSGELKIPGYSSYLEDLGNGLVLGIGREAGDLKLSLFDVTDVKNPKEVSKYLLKNNWSDAENNHHAFLHDADHDVFFIPGSDGGYIFSYTNKELTLKKTVAGNNTKRAIYVGDNLYVIADDKITVIDESSWTTVKEWEIK